MHDLLRGASGDNLAALTDKVSTVGESQAARLGEDLFAVAALLRGEPSLRRVATDPSIDGSAKAGLIRGVLDGKVGAEALDVVADAVSRRWAAGRDLADTLEHLGVVAVVRSTNEGSRLSDELFEVARAVSANADLRDALSDPARSIEDKRGLLRGLLEGKVLPATLTLVAQSLSGSHRTVNAAISSFQKVAATVYGESVATVRTARPLGASDRERLAAALSRNYGRPVHLNVVVEPGLIGGLRIEIGDDVIDGTVASRLDDARRQLAG